MLSSFRTPSLAMGLIASCLAGAAGASQAQHVTDQQDTMARSHVPFVGVLPRNGLPGGIVNIHRPGQGEDRSNDTRTPIKHVILIIGENRTFDHIYATYKPPKGQTIRNLRSEGIVKANGRPGPNIGDALQWKARDVGAFSVTPKRTAPYVTLPKMNTDGAPTQPHFSSAEQAQAVEPALPRKAYAELAEGGTGLPGKSIDTRFPKRLPNAPVDRSHSLSYHDYAASPVHRFFQMWQQLDCDVKAATRDNPSGCRNDLFPWVETSVGAGSNGKARPADFTDQTTGEGSTSMQFFNMAKGDAPYFAKLAHKYTLSDNFHQSVMGGTGANHIMLGYGTMIYYADANGRPTMPPQNQIENPDPMPGTNNWYTQDGYSGGSYVDCQDDSQPGVASVRDYLKSLPYHVSHHDCLPHAYYLVNNYNPGYLGDGTPAPLGDNQFTIPPTRQDNIGLLLSRHHVSWKYYGEGWDGGKEDGEGGTYCNICNPFLYSTQIMTNPKLRANNVDINDLYSDIQNDSLPAVSIAKPDALLDGHPASSKLELLAGFVKKIVKMVKANPKTWNDTAIMVTFDEGGGYWDSGYVQPIDFFGDGTRIPMLVISKYSTGGRVVHTYYDHVSFDKFVEANWGIHETISRYSRDNLPNPVSRPNNPYVPVNAPALGNMMDMFNFDQDDHHGHHSHGHNLVSVSD